MTPPRHPLDDRGVVLPTCDVEQAVRRRRAIESGEWSSVIELLPVLLRKRVARALAEAA